MANDINRRVKVYIEGSEAMTTVGKLQDKLSGLEQKLVELQNAGKGNSKEAKKLQSEIDATTKQYNKYNNTVNDTKRILNNLSGATYNELIKVKAQLDRQLKTTTRDTEQYNNTLRVHKAVCKEVEAAQKDMRTEIGCQGTAFGKVAGFFNKYLGMFGVGILSIQRITSVLSGFRDELIKVEESKADVKALTGLDDASVEWLTNQAKKLSSSVTDEGIRIRQSVSEILEAYKLVGSAKPELLNDKEGLAEVTKQTMILASASGMELKNAVDAVTLSLNQYGAGADQASKFVNILAAGSKYGSAAVESETEAIVKSGVAASSAKVPMEQLVGSIETLAEKGIKDELAGTGLKNFFITLQTGAKDTNPAIVGLDKALENLQKKNLSTTAIKDMFGKENYNVASVLINSAEKVKYYTQAVTDTNVAVEQAQIKSQTLAAKLAQAKNRFTDIGVELVGKLHPAMTSGINLMSKGMNIIISLISFLDKYGKDILIVTGAIAGYTVAANASVIIDKLKVLWTDKIVVSLKNMYAVMLKNPYAVIGALILTWILYMKHAHEELTNIQVAQKAVNDVESEAQQNIAQQKVELESLLAVAKDEKKSKDDRLAAIKKLNEISPEYLGNLTLDKINTTEAKKAVDKYVESIYNMAKAQAAKDRIVEIEKQKIKLDTDPEQFNELIPEWQKWGVGFVNSFSKNLGNKLLGKIVEKGRETRDKLKSQLDAEEAALKKMIADSTTTINDISTTPENTKEDADTGGDQMTEKEKKKAAAAAKRAASAAKKEAEAEKKAKLDEVKKYIEEKKELLEKDYNQGIITKTQYNARMYQLEIESLNRQLAAYGVNSSKRKEIEKKIVEYKNKILELGFQEYTKNMEKEAKKEKEEKARRKKHLDDLNNDLQKSSQQAIQIYEDENAKRKEQQDKMTETVKSYAEEIGNIIGGAITGNNDLVKSSIVAIINMGLDALEITAEMAAAEAVMKGGGQAGLAGLAKGAIVAGVIKAAFTTVKALVSSMVYNIGSNNSSSSVSGESKTQNTGQYVVNGYYVGGYSGNGDSRDVAGPVHYNEYVVPSFVLSEPRAMNYVSALESMRRMKTNANTNQLPNIGYANGGFTPSNSNESLTNDIAIRLISAIENIKAYVVYSDIEKAKNTLDKAKNIGGK